MSHCVFRSLHHMLMMTHHAVGGWVEEDAGGDCLWLHAQGDTLTPCGEDRSLSNSLTLLLSSDCHNYSRKLTGWNLNRIWEIDTQQNVTHYDIHILFWSIIISEGYIGWVILVWGVQRSTLYVLALLYIYVYINSICKLLVMIQVQITGLTTPSFQCSTSLPTTILAKHSKTDCFKGTVRSSHVINQTLLVSAHIASL